MYRDGSQALSGSDLTIATMANVAAGSYSITAKTVSSPTGFGDGDTLTCTLVAGGTTLDQAEFSNANHASTLTMVGTVTFASTNSILLRCRVNSNSASVRLSRIVAVKVDSIQRDAVSG